MKVNLVPSTIALGLGCLIAYGFYAFGDHSAPDMRLAFTLSALLFACITLLSAIGIEFGTGRTTAVIRSVAGAAFLFGLGVLVILSLFTSSIPLLVIVMGTITLVFILVAYAVGKSGQ